MSSKVYECGTLRYSLGGLVFAVGLILFAFFCFTFTTSVVNTILPLQLKEVLGADNKTITLIMGTIGGIFNITVCPAVSFKSDRYRSRWGRRIPFILWTLPMYVAGILLFAFAGEIAGVIREYAHLTALAPATVTICVIGLVMVIYQFFYMFVGSVIYYIYNDVIPVAFQARVVGAVHVASTAAVTVFNLFLLRFSVTHFKLLMISTAVVYIVGVGLMCLLLKEPEYPPVSADEAKESDGKRGVITFMRESFSHPFYWYAFLSSSLLSVSGVGTFLIFFNQNMGLSLESIGKLFGVQGIIGTVLSLSGAAVGTLLIDRWHPVRVYLFGILLALLEPLAYLKFLYATPPPLVFWWSSMILAVILRISGTLYSFSSMPLLMRTYPKSRFGQFCSACAMLRSILVLIFGLILGCAIDLLKYQGGLGDFAYRWIWGWRLFWMFPAVIFFVLFYRQWLKLGGDRFCAPAPWSATGKEEMPVTDVAHPTEKLVRWGMLSAGAAVGLHILMAAALILLAFTRYGSGKLLASLAGPAALIVLIAFGGLSRSVNRDLRRIRESQTPKNGIPHHGMLFLSAITSAGLSGIGFYQAFSVLADGVAAAWFWCSETCVLLVILGLIYLTIRLDRGYAVLAVTGSGDEGK